MAQRQTVVISFDDTEEDDFDTPSATPSTINSSFQAPSTSASSSSSSSAAHSAPSHAHHDSHGSSTLTSSVNSTSSTLTTSVNSTASSNSALGEAEEKPLPAPKSFKFPTAYTAVNSDGTRARPPTVPADAKQRPVTMPPQKTYEDSSLKGKKEKPEGTGTLSKIASSLFKTKKAEPEKKKVTIGGPSNFHHVAGQGPASAAIAATVSSVSSSSAASTHSSEEEKPDSASTQGAVMRKGSSSSSTKLSTISDDNGGEMLQSDPKAFTKLTKKKIDELVSGAYFLMHTKNSTQQKFISCSDDLSRIHFWPSYNEKDDGVPPHESMNFAEVLGIKLGYSTQIFKDTGKEGRQVLAFSFVLTSRTLDLEAFTPDDRDFWVESFNGLISFFKAQPIPQPNQPGRSTAGPVSSL